MPPKRSGAPGAKGDEGPQKSKLQQKSDDGEFLIGQAFQMNTRTLANCRIFSGIIAGCIAGLLRFEGLSGIAVFILVTVLHSAMIFAKTTFNVTRYFPRTRDIFLQQPT